MHVTFFTSLCTPRVSQTSSLLQLPRKTSDASVWSRNNVAQLYYSGNHSHLEHCKVRLPFFLNIQREREKERECVCTRVQPTHTRMRAKTHTNTHSHREREYTCTAYTYTHTGYLHRPTATRLSIHPYIHTYIQVKCA